MLAHFKQNVLLGSWKVVLSETSLTENHNSRLANDKGYRKLQPPFAVACMGHNLSDRFSFHDVRIRITLCSSCGDWPDWQNFQLFTACCPIVMLYYRGLEISLYASCWSVFLPSCILLKFFPRMLHSMRTKLDAGRTLLHVSFKYTWLQCHGTQLNSQCCNVAWWIPYE